MDKKTILRLKEFYILETFQVAFYQAQADSAADNYYRKSFAKLVETEQRHADYFAGLLTSLKESVPTVTGSLFDLAGSISGEATEAFGPTNVCRLGVALEKEAIETYQEFIREAENKKELGLKDRLTLFMHEEELHALWLEDYEVQQRKPLETKQ